MQPAREEHEQRIDAGQQVRDGVDAQRGGASMQGSSDAMAHNRSEGGQRGSGGVAAQRGGVGMQDSSDAMAQQQADMVRGADASGICRRGKRLPVGACSAWDLDMMPVGQGMYI
jgi:hypothetical protein